MRTSHSRRAQWRAPRRIDLSFPGMILELGPEFIVTGKADAPSNVGASASIAYNLSVLATTFRPQCGSTGDTFNQGASAPQRSLSPRALTSRRIECP